MARAAAVAAMALAAAGCASLVRHAVRPYLVGPDGQELPERALRTQLAAAGWDAALAHARSPKLGGPPDALLRALYEGTVAYYAGRWDESATALDRAAAMAEDRYTKSASRGALAIATSDRALPYVPGHTERLFVHYYALLGFLQRQDLEGAAVEARRLSFLLQQYDEDRDPLDAPTRAVLRYVAGAAFEAAGERNDADVAYRNAAALAALAGRALPEAGGLALASPARVSPAPASPAPASLGPASPAAARPRRARAAPPDRPPPTGEVLVVVEQGFVAHRVAESAYLTFDDEASQRRFVTSGRSWSDDPALGRALSRLAGDAGLWAGAAPPVLALHDSAHGDSARAAVLRGASADATDAADAPRAATSASASSAATPAVLESRSVPAAAATRADATVVGTASRHYGGASAGGAWSPGGSALKLAWPAFRRSAPPLLGGVVFLRDQPPPDTATATAPGSVAVALRADVSDAVAADLKRDRAKLLTRLVARAATRAALLAGASKKSRDLAELVAGASRVVEQADTRSWHLLPASIGVARVRLPAGRHVLAVRVDGRDVPLGEVEVRAGGLAFATVRAWSGSTPSPAASSGI